jgi:UPF0755 protein
LRRFLALFLILAGLVAAFFAANLTLPAGPAQETFVEIAPGMGARQIGRMLQSQKIVRSRYAFDLWHLLRGGTLKAGEYRFAEQTDLPSVYDRIRRGDVYTRTVTIPEGFNLFDIAQAIQNAQLGSQESILSAARKDVDLIADLDPQATSLEGYLFPDTYRFQRHQAPAEILGAMVKRFREASHAIGLRGDFHRTVILASIIEKETPIPEDRPLVASVFENRLAIGMPLMTDPTVIYAARLESRYRGGIYQSDLKADSPYNTYRHAGLPPGPICSPGFAALQAALHPAKTNYLYFVADPAALGHSRFASTLAEHERNVSAYRNALKAQTNR